MEGRGLVAKDTAFFSRKKSSDPYVKVSMGKHSLGKTKIVDKDLSPKWNEEFKKILKGNHSLEAIILPIYYGEASIAPLRHEAIGLDHRV